MAVAKIARLVVVDLARADGGLPQGKDHEVSITGQPVHRSKSRPLMSGQGQTRSFGNVGSMSGLPETGHG
jgi:hypothetical protein